MKKLYIETYGCQMNVADSEVVASVMKMAGYETTESLEEADAVLLNTCSVRDNAEQKIFNRLEMLSKLRAQHPTPNTQHPTPNTQHPTPNPSHHRRAGLYGRAREGGPAAEPPL